MLERCLNCGWTGREDDKIHSSLSAMKGPGLCPDCGSEEFDECPLQDVSETQARGKRLARVIVEHLEGMAFIPGAPPESAQVYVDVNDILYRVTFSAERVKPHIHVATEGTDKCAECGMDIRDAIHTTVPLLERLKMYPKEAPDV